MYSHEVLDDTVELVSLVAVTKLLAVFLDTGRKSPEVLCSLGDGLTTRNINIRHIAESFHNLTLP